MNSIDLVFPQDIKSVYTFSQAGTPLFVKTRVEVEKQVDHELMAGFLSAVFSFAGEMTETGSMRVMEAGNSIFVFETVGKCIFAIEGTGNLAFLQSILHEITIEWGNRFGLNSEILEEGGSLFETFTEDLHQIFQRHYKRSNSKMDAISIPYLLKLIRRGIDRVIGAMLGGDRVIVMGDRAQVELAVTTLELFASSKREVVPWTNQMIESADLIGIPLGVLDAPPDNAVVLDLTESKVLGGHPNKFARNLLQNLENLQLNKAIELINTNIDVLSSKVAKFSEFSQKRQLTPEVFSNLIKDLDPDSVTLLLKIAQKKYPTIYPELYTLYQSYMEDPGTRLESYLDDF